MILRTPRCRLWLDTTRFRSLSIWAHRVRQLGKLEAVCLVTPTEDTPRALHRAAHGRYSGILHELSLLFLGNVNNAVACCKVKQLVLKVDFHLCHLWTAKHRTPFMVAGRTSFAERVLPGIKLLKGLMESLMDLLWNKPKSLLGFQVVQVQVFYCQMHKTTQGQTGHWNS